MIPTLRLGLLPGGATISRFARHRSAAQRPAPPRTAPAPSHDGSFGSSWRYSSRRSASRRLATSCGAALRAASHRSKLSLLFREARALFVATLRREPLRNAALRCATQNTAPSPRLSFGMRGPYPSLRIAPPRLAARRTAPHRTASHRTEPSSVFRFCWALSAAPRRHALHRQAALRWAARRTEPRRAFRLDGALLKAAHRHATCRPVPRRNAPHRTAPHPPPSRLRGALVHDQDGGPMT